MANHIRKCTPKPGNLSPNEEKELRAALYMVVGALDARPKENDDFWDALVRTDAEVRHPKWLNKLTETIRTALDAGAQEGPGTQAATVHRVHVFFAALEAITLRGYESPSVDNFADELVTLTEESADVTVAASRALKDPSESNLEALRFAVMESAAEDERVLDLASRRLADERSHRPVARAFA